MLVTAEINVEDWLEFAAEGERWYDLVYRGIAESILNAYFAKEYPCGRPCMSDAHLLQGVMSLFSPQPQMNYSFGVYKQKQVLVKK